MSVDEADHDDATPEKGLLSALFSGCSKPTLGRIDVLKNRLQETRARQRQEKKHRRDELRKKENDPNRQQSSEQLQLYLLLTDMTEKLEANRERLRTLDRYNDALSIHIQKLRDGEDNLFNPDGSLVDEAAEAVIIEREEEQAVSTGLPDPWTGHTSTGVVRGFSASDYVSG